MMNPEERGARFKKTVERVAPSLDIDQTKILSDEELEALRKQTAERHAAQKLAAETGRVGLRRRLTQAVEAATEEDGAAP